MERFIPPIQTEETKSEKLPTVNEMGGVVIRSHEDFDSCSDSDDAEYDSNIQTRTFDEVIESLLTNDEIDALVSAIMDKDTDPVEFLVGEKRNETWAEANVEGSFRRGYGDKIFDLRLVEESAVSHVHLLQLRSQA